MALDVAVAAAFTKIIAQDLRYYDTDQHRLGRDYHGHYVAALKLAFRAAAR